MVLVFFFSFQFDGVKNVSAHVNLSAGRTSLLFFFFEISSACFGLREHPVVSALSPPGVIFRRERSDDRKYVCGSQAIHA